MSATEHAEAAVREIVDSLVAAWNDHDASRFAAAFHDDADFTQTALQQANA